MGKLNDRIYILEEKQKELISVINSLSTNTEEKSVTPYTKIGGIRERGLIRVLDPKAGWTHMGGMLIWNDAELVHTDTKTKPGTPTEGYNKHSHSRYAGGALDVNTLEFVEFDFDDDQNPHSQQFFITDPSIVNAGSENGVSIPKIGKLDLDFDTETTTWKVKASEIDVKKTYLVMRDSNGDIVLDVNGNEMKSPLWNQDTTKTNVIWDANAKVWRFLAVYSDEGEVI